MIDHLNTYTTNYDVAKRFYEAVLAPLGFTVTRELVASSKDLPPDWDRSWPTARLCAFGPAPRPQLWLLEAKERGRPMHVAFEARDNEAVDAFYAAALAAGGKDNGKAGPRPETHVGCYAAFVVDPDGNNIEAVCHNDL